MTLDPTSTIQDAKEYLNANISKGTHCPVCKQRVKLDKRSVTHRQAATLILLHKTFPVGAVVHINQFITGLQPPEFANELLQGREWHKLKYWGLLSEVDVTKDVDKAFREAYPDSKGKKIKGSLYRLTENGAAFVQGTPIVKSVFVFEDVVYGWDAETSATIHDALNSKFDFTALWNAVAPATGHIFA